MPNLQSVVESMIETGAFRKTLLNPISQFGRPRREYLGARFMPERLVPNNRYTETGVKYRTVVANDGSRYSPAQKKGNDIVGNVEVSLSEQDIASEFTSEDFDNHIQMSKLNAANENEGNPTFAGMVALTNWADQRINLPLIEKIEKMRWEAIVDAMVPLRGDNGYELDVNLSNPNGHRFNAGEDWTDANDDPLQDIYDMADLFAGKGYTLGALVSGRPVIQTLLRHPKVVSAVGGYVNVDNTGALMGNGRYVTLDALNAFLGKDDLPPIISYNLQYRTQTDTEFFLKRDVMVGFALTGRDVSIDRGDDEALVLLDTVGYVGVGRTAGEERSGRAGSVEFFSNKPPRAEFEGWQTSFPVNMDPEAIAVITSINTA